ncbi:MAG: orotidine-5'-phosphate decarboxylase [Gammaproteobacteria bacterium]
MTFSSILADNNKTRVIIALDNLTEVEVMQFIEKLDPDYCKLKIGKELFVRYGPQLIKRLQQHGYDIFLDLKFLDIPHQVAGAVTAAAELGVWMVDVHALGGARMLQAARQALDDYAQQQHAEGKQIRLPLLIAVTILTSFTANDLHQIGLGGEPQHHVLHLAKLAQSAGMDGVVCSAHEAAMLRAELGQTFCLVTPGIRLPHDASIQTAKRISDEDDQRRIMTPEQALQAGANYLVMGRSIRHLEKPLEFLQAINNRTYEKRC